MLARRQHQVTRIDNRARTRCHHDVVMTPTESPMRRVRQRERGRDRRISHNCGGYDFVTIESLVIASREILARQSSLRGLDQVFPGIHVGGHTRERLINKGC